MSSLSTSDPSMHSQDISVHLQKLKLSHDNNDSHLYSVGKDHEQDDNDDEGYGLTNGNHGSFYGESSRDFSGRYDGQKRVPDFSASALSQLDLSNIPLHALESILPLLGITQNGINNLASIRNENGHSSNMSNGNGTNQNLLYDDINKDDIPASGVRGDILNYMLSGMSGNGSQPGQSSMNGNHMSPIHSSKGMPPPYPPNGMSQKLNQPNPNYFSDISFNASLQQKISQKKQTMDYLLGNGSAGIGIESQEKRYMTTTERIKVPSSDHVAEIVGKNGQRIKQLREQLKVWVKTPSRDEPPVFEVTGLPEKLAEAKRIILQMSDHFTKVQQERLQRTEPNRMEDRLYVEQDKVGLIVGASGQTIRWVQQLSDTHIATPRKQETIPGLPPPQTFFTICGTPEKVRFAKQLICEYVMLRCQGLWLDSQLEPSSEAARLVREFHQRRQVEDSQRRNVTPQDSCNTTPVLSRNPMAAGIAPQGRPLVGGLTAEKAQGSALADYLNSVGTDLHLRMRNDIEDVWGTGAVLGANSSDSSGPDSPHHNGNTWGSSFLYGAGFGLGDRRFSADHSGPGNGNALGLNLPESGNLRKSLSDEQVSPATGYKPGPGWM